MNKYTLCILLLAITTSVWAQSTYYVSESQGSDDNNGTSEASAFATISYASSVSQPGDVINILPGTYRNTGESNLYDEFAVANSGSPGNYITYRGVADAQGNLPKLVSASLTGFTVNNRSYIIVENLEMIPSEEDIHGFISSPSSDFGLEGWRRRRAVGLFGNSHHVIVRNLYVHDFPGNGIQVGAADVVLIENNLVEHCAYQTSEANSGISIYQPALLSVPGFEQYPNHRLIFRGNTSRYNVNLRSFTSSFGTGTLTDGNGIIIDDLRLEQGGGTPYAGRTLVLDNVCYGNGGYGINVFSSDRVDVYHNTMFDNAQSTRIDNPAYEVAVQDAQLQVGRATDVNVVNNILANGNASAQTYFLFETGEVTFRRNLHWNTQGSVDNVSADDIVADPQFVQASGLTAQQTQLLATMTNPFDPNAASAQLRTPTQNNGFPVHNLRTEASSAAIDAGTDVGFRTAQGNGPDIGAFEFDGTGDPEPPAPTPTGNVVMRARGNTGQERLEIRYNDQVVGEPIVLSTQFEEYSVQVDNPTGTFQVAFINDNEERNVVLDWLQVNEERQQAEDQAVNTASFTEEGGCGSGRFTQEMFCEGYVDFGGFGNDSPEAGSIVVRAKGDCGIEVIELHVDGTKVDEWTASTTYADYTYSGFGGGEVSVHFRGDNFGQNDPTCSDSNLEVDYIEVCGTRYETETTATETASCCTWDPDKLYTNGNFNYGTLTCVGASENPTQPLRPSQTLRAYPNPASQLLTVQGGPDYGIVLYDLMGRPVMRHPHLRGQATLDISPLRPGVYLLKSIDAEGETVQQRVVIE